jgi:hypothetical protein
MAEGASSFKKVAVLTGLSIMAAGAEISQADATTISQTKQFLLTKSANFGISTDQTVNFLGFNSALGTLTGVHFSLDSIVTAGGDIIGGPTTALFSPSGATINSQLGTGQFDFTGLAAPDSLTNYLGALVGIKLSLDAVCEGTCTTTWRGIDGEAGLTITYDFNATPLPAALPLFATGLAGLGAAALRKRRKQKADA